MALREADVQQIELQRDSLGARADRVVADINTFLSTVNQQTFDTARSGELLEAATDTIADINTARETSNVLEGRSDPTWTGRVTEAVTDLATSRDSVSDARSQLQAAITDAGLREPDPDVGTNSAGEIADADATNRTEFANTQNPGTSPEQGNLTVQTPSNADDNTLRGQVTYVDEQTNASAEDSGRSAPSQPTTTQGADGVSVAVGNNSEIVPFNNVLSQFATSTYQATIYLLTPSQYNKMMGASEDANASDDIDSQAVKSVEGFSAILSSGGLPNGFIGDPYTIGGAVRNRFFNLDYFIDDIDIETLMTKRVGGATNVSQLSFKVTEPYGFTFLNRLKTASLDLMTNETPEAAQGSRDWVKQHYLMVIRFYGQTDSLEETGEYVETSGSVSGDTINVTAQMPVTEKYIPFQFSNITTRARNGAVEYECTAVPINQNQAMGQKNATAKYQIEIQGQSLEGLFNGKFSQDIVNNEERLLSTGLIESINKYWKKLETDGLIGRANEYQVVFRDGIGKHKIKPPGSTKKDRTAMADSTFPTLLTASKGSVQKNRMTFSINAGTQIQQVLDLVIRSSTYISNQQKSYIDPNTKQLVQKPNNNFLQWFKITSKSTVLGWDEIRKDYAYKIVYTVVPSTVYNVRSPHFPDKKFNGTHKRYKYWFTGENTEILEYEAEVNNQFYVSSSPFIAQDLKETATVGETSSPGPAEQSIIGGSDLSSDPAARAASTLYSPGDFQTLQMKILGDPFYIQQGDIFWRSYGIQDDNPGYLPDGSADYESGDILIEIDYNTMEDYNEETGEADVRPIELKSPGEIEATTTDSGKIYRGLVYKVVQVNNVFNQGVFTQNIQGVLINFTANEYNTIAGDPEALPTNNVSGGPKVDYSNETYVPTTLNLKSINVTATGPTTTTPVLGGLTLSGATYQAPPDDAN